MVYDLFWRLRQTNAEISKDDIIYRVEKGPDFSGYYTDIVYYLDDDKLRKDYLNTDFKSDNNNWNKVLKSGSFLEILVKECSEIIPIVIGGVIFSYVLDSPEFRKLLLEPHIYVGVFGYSFMKTLIVTNKDDEIAFKKLNERREELWQDEE
ncbi:hypothetical protein HN681_00620 [archaeon]|jgi:hypothetical protein|nr:hypothetical protein [archaeon]MBT3730711.1 hypothetical protein [archaeon]MBT4669613.1 hypothetical protein [archaeon]MBT7052979.1 hypothetical protein [archaeon]MBT8009930.1 hypothetical protein [archaeon]